MISFLVTIVFGYSVLFLSNYDGDTVALRVALWPGLYQEVSVRLYGVDTPEIRGSCAKEKELALDAKEWVAQQLEDSLELGIILHGSDRYGRPLVTVFKDGENFNVMLIEQPFAKEWDGAGARPLWCANGGDP